MDGTGNPWHYGDVAIENGRIAAMGHNLDDEAKQIIDVSGLAIAPGFIDMHTHTELTYLVKPDEICKISQGVTTEIGGLCALSPAPVNEKTRASIENMKTNKGKSRVIAHALKHLMAQASNIVIIYSFVLFE